MADSEEFVVLSKVRTGHKREFEFALRSQNEVAGSLGRTRVRRVPSPVAEVPSPKRVNRPVGRPRKGKGPDVSESEDEPKSDVVDVVSDDETHRCQLVESRRRGNEGGGGGGNERDPVVENEGLGGASVTGCDVHVKKLPTKLKELLDTGLLEGLSVNYIRGVKKPLSSTTLSGTIRKGGILCFCDDCKGAQVVKPNQFELHAGSLNKRVADYTYLENGRTLRDVLTSCKSANHDSIAHTILNAISSSPVKKSVFCFGCRGPMPETATGRTILLCDSCSELKASQMTPTRATDAVDTCERSSKSASLQKSSNGAPKTSSSSNKSQGKITRKDLRLHKLVFQDDFLPDGTALGYYVRGKKVLSGYKKGFGIFCFCCSTKISPSQFEAHAGCASRKKPYLNIYTSNGASLHELSLNLSKIRPFSTDENDDLCSICRDAGDLLCCDGCPRAFHIECIPLSSIPQDKWYCRYCEDMFKKEKFAECNPNAIAAGRVPGIDPIEQITNRCIRIVKALDTQDGICCVLCRAQDFCKSGFGPRTVIICDQCEKEYHVGCLREHKMHYLKELPEGDWLCSSGCEKIHSTLKDLVEHGEQMLPKHLIDIIKKKQMEKGLNGDDLDIRWRVFNRRMSCLEDIRPLLSKAVSVFHEQFDPIHYGDLKQDLIPHMVYGRDLKDREFGGMFCAVLSVNSTIVSAGVFRVFGNEVAEVPIVATSKDCEGKGYFQCLYTCIERLLGHLDVKNILLPAAEEVTSMWTNRFGFKVIPKEELNNLSKHYALMFFEGTSMLCKPVPDSRT